LPTPSKLIDVNVLSIFLVDDHPGSAFVDRVMNDGLAGHYRLLVPDQLPLRARWVLVNKWSVPGVDADNAIKDFLQHRRVYYVGADRQTLLKAYELARILRHDVYDTFYLALAIRHSASAIVTTDTSFKGLCRQVKIDYENPVPEDVLSRFSAIRG